MNRKEFLKSGVLLSGPTLLPVQSVFSQYQKDNNVDKLDNLFNIINWDNCVQRLDDALKLTC